MALINSKTTCKLFIDNVNNYYISGVHLFVLVHGF
jgi:hypothetical protein